MNKKVSLYWFLIYAIVFIGISLYIERNKDFKFKSQIDNLEKEREELHKKNKLALDSINALNIKLERIYFKIDSLDQRIKTVKTQRHEIPAIVDSMPVTEIDSILTGYVHPRGN